jgi:hypothetical protein
VTAPFLSFDMRALASALDAARVERGLTWKHVASCRGFTEGMLRNLAAAPAIGDHREF